MEAFWSDTEAFLLSIKKEDQREEHVESKLQAMIVFDLVQRMFIPTLLVKYVSYTAMEAYYNFSHDIFDHDGCYKLEHASCSNYG